MNFGEFARLNLEIGTPIEVGLENCPHIGLALGLEKAPPKKGGKEFFLEPLNWVIFLGLLIKFWENLNSKTLGLPQVVR